MAVNIDKYPDNALFIYGQVPITKEEYRKLSEEGNDMSMVLPSDNPNPVPSAIGDGNTDNDLDITMNNIMDTLDRLSNPNKDVQYEYDAGHESTEYSPYDKGSTRLDEDAFLGWTAYELGYIDSSIAISDVDTILSNLVRVTPDSTKDDTQDYKISIINSTANIGDILMFDTPNRYNGLTGFYTGTGSFISIYTQNNSDKNDIAEYNLWEINEDGENIPTGWLDVFNGGIYRTELLNSEAYVWYNNTENN